MFTCVRFFLHLSNVFFISNINLNYSNQTHLTIVLGLSLRNCCRKGENCNFLHIFKNPSDLFSIERTLRQSSNVISSQRSQATQNDTTDEYVTNFCFVIRFSQASDKICFFLFAAGTSMAKGISEIGDGQRVQSKTLRLRMTKSQKETWMKSDTREDNAVEAKTDTTAEMEVTVKLLREAKAEIDTNATTTAIIIIIIKENRNEVIRQVLKNVQRN